MGHAPRRRQVVALVVVLAVVAPAGAPVVGATGDGGPGAATVDAERAQVSTVGLTQRFAALPDRPGTVRATRRFEIPDSVATLETSVPSGATVIETRGGFSHAGGDTYAWEDGSDTASITYRLPVNETGTASGPEGADGEYRFVDVGEWGLFRRPPAPIDVSYYGSGIEFDRRTAVDGAGAAGDWLVFVGEATVHRHTANGQSFRLVEPAAADMAEPPGAVLDSVAAAAGSLQVGARDETVLVIAAPTTVEWGVEGLQVGKSDFYATDDETLDEAGNTWLHEYVHTRQAVDLARDARWLTEATATYYAALLTLRQERIGFDAFRDALGVGTQDRYSDAVLADPATWTAGANYFKGSLVTGELDRRIRLATDSGRSFQAVHRRLNERSDTVDAAEFESIVAELSSTSVGDAAGRYAETRDTPPTWDRAAHQDAFGELPARITYDLPDGVETNYRIAGPYRNVTTGTPLVLVPDERLGVELTVRNVGGTTGEYRIEYGRTGEEPRALSGTVEAGQAVVERLWIPAGDAGESTVRVGEFERTLRVVEPATLEVTELSVNRTTVPPDGSVELSVDVRNPEGHPGERTLTVARNGNSVASKRVRLGGGETGSVSFPVRLGESGASRLTVADRSVTVTVATPGPTDTPGPSPSTGTAGERGPGVGVPGAVLALVVGGWLRARG